MGKINVTKRSIAFTQYFGAVLDKNLFMTLEDIVKTNFINKICFNSIYTKSSNDRGLNLVFLCGGKGEDSFRNLLHNKLQQQNINNNKFVLAEDALKWSKAQEFADDLLELEKYFAAVVGKIIIISESPGAIAELGSFISDKDIKKKILVVIENKYRKEDSFINNGLLKNLLKENSNEDCQSNLCVIDDIPIKGNQKDYTNQNENLNTVISAINSFNPPSSKVDFSKKYFQTLFILDLIILTKIVTRQELKKFVSLMVEKYNKDNNNDIEITNRDINQIIFILKELKLIVEYEKGNTKYYIAKTRALFLRYININIKEIQKVIIEILNDKDNMGKKELLNKFGTYSIAEDMDEKTAISLAPLLYKVFYIPKKNGELREIAQPTAIVKNIQRKKLEELYKILPVHSLAKAYIKGTNGIFENANIHKKSKYFLKLDFCDFFHSIKADNFNELLKNKKIQLKERLEFIKIFFMFNKQSGKSNTKIVYKILKSNKDDNIILNAICKIFKENFQLSIGAPSSPMLSNMIMYEFDEQIEQWARKQHLLYTRYADDLTFSSSKKLKKTQIITKINEIINKIPYLQIKLNTQKTKTISSAKRVSVTGLNITSDNKISIGRMQKKKIRVMLHYVSQNKLSQKKILYLKGWLSYIKSVEHEHFDYLCKKYPKEIAILNTK